MAAWQLAYGSRTTASRRCLHRGAATALYWHFSAAAPPSPPPPPGPRRHLSSARQLSSSSFLPPPTPRPPRPSSHPSITSSRPHHAPARHASTIPTDRRSVAAAMVAQDFEAVLKGKYPAKAHARRVVDVLRPKATPQVDSGVFYLESTRTKLQEDNDSAEHFRQRRFFYYLTGCNMADCAVAYHVAADKLILFIPPIDPDDVIWSGLPVSIDDALARYDVDEVRYTSDVNATLTQLASRAGDAATVFALAGQVSDNVTFLEFAHKDFAALKPAMETARVVKDEFEVAMIRKANHISSLAHKAVIQRARSARYERELEAAFLERCVAHGAKEMAYHPILAGGKAAATLHYVDNNAPLDGKQNVLIDAGAEWDNYASDITRTFPLSGKFTKESRDIYDIVYKMQHDCTAMIKAGALWDDIHLHAHKIAIAGLLALGILRGDANDILAARTSAAFFPHGLGHYLGLDTHDVGGNPNRADKDALFRYLRLRGVIPAGSVVTVEPGVYFCEFIIRPYLDDPVHSKFIDAAVLDRYWDVGGVRIEDNILVTETGYENLTTAIKEAAEIEATVASG
ncbi:Xaa-Pro dipeptidase [Purpureocillium takamizusanense]|uniref:Xaa-Pro aminopeptidase n=1 Tax=Purpureocillium takamizusanense TaxID=2060973 RepID=A0A9Q8QHH8_9HYPO|nr:Xaa-Pro dipeptidase [Purpureocillium takamizusanense]UNI19347.1 Xaa-Pro dipeptidase [Purpureocillium takamizusanense]